MNILLTAHRFFPDIGGTETATESMAQEFSKAGHSVVVVTNTPGEPMMAGYEVVRRPNALRMLQLCQWCDVILQRTVALRTTWPLLFLRRPWVVINNDWIDRGNGIRIRLKRLLIRRATNIAISRAVADRLPVPSTVILNAYRSEVFKPPLCENRLQDLIFVGRLIRGKGVQILIDAVRELERRGIRRGLTIVGCGPEAPEFERAAEGLPIKFIGVKRDHELSEIIGAHKILVVPSLEPEPFGIVALEGLACGCLVVVSAHGGLPEAIGPHGILFEPGNSRALAQAILAAEAAAPELQNGVPRYLKRHEASYVANRYLQVMEQAITEFRTRMRQRASAHIGEPAKHRPL